MIDGWDTFWGLFFVGCLILSGVLWIIAKARGKDWFNHEPEHWYD